MWNVFASVWFPPFSCHKTKTRNAEHISDRQSVKQPPPPPPPTTTTFPNCLVSANSSKKWQTVHWCSSDPGNLPWSIWQGGKKMSLRPVCLRLSRRRHNVTRTTEQHSPSGWIESARPVWPVCRTANQTAAHQCGWHHTKNRSVEQPSASFLLHQTGLYLKYRDVQLINKYPTQGRTLQSWRVEQWTRHTPDRQHNIGGIMALAC